MIPPARDRFGPRGSGAVISRPRRSVSSDAGGSDAMKPRKTGGGGRANVGGSRRAGAMEPPDARKVGRDRRADVGNSRAVKLMKIAAAKAAVESPARKPRSDRHRASGETARRMNAAGAKLMKPWTTAKSRSGGDAAPAGGRDANDGAPGRRDGINRFRRLGMRNDDVVAMMAPDQGAAEAGRVKRADPTKPIVPFVAAAVPAPPVPAVVIVAVATAELNPLNGRQTFHGHAGQAADTRPRAVRDSERRQGQRQGCENARRRMRHDGFVPEGRKARASAPGECRMS